MPQIPRDLFQIPSHLAKTHKYKRIEKQVVKADDWQVDDKVFSYY